jgi:uncharacterized protein YkwD
MKTSFYLLSLLFFLPACDSFNKAKNADIKKDSSESSQVSVDSSAIPSEYSLLDSLPSVDSIAVIEPEEPKNPLEYMNIEEKGMIDEINLLRADPQAYAQFIDGYIQSFVIDPSKDADTKRKEMAAAGELITELQTLEPLPALKPHYKLYQVAKSHAQELVKLKSLSPVGIDGAHLFQRIRDDAELDGSETLFAGYASIRQSIILLLIEGGIAGHTPEVNLLDPSWEFTTCYEVGAVGDFKNVWIQLFGFTPEEVEEDADEFLEIDSPVEPENVVATSAIVLKNQESQFDEKYPFLTTEEKEMVDEINLLRSNPAGYIQYVQLYAEKYKKQYPEEDEDFTKAVEELKQELKNTQSLSQLQLIEELYNVAKAHGLDNKNNNRLEHIGSDQSDPFDRIRRSGLKNNIDKKGYFTPNENLVGGEDSARESVVALLIDAGVPSRGHRRALLEPNWKYVACYKIGLIENLEELSGQEKDDMNNCWVQLFAKD